MTKFAEENHTHHFLMTTIIDPVYGFIHIPLGLLRNIVKHPYFQRLERIHQLGTSAMVYPGAQHTRKQHSLGAYHLMTRAFSTLASKGVFLFDSEVEATEAAILMHDLGHGPYSHVLESVFVPGMSHETISLMMMEQINEAMHGELSLAISIFKDEHPKHFLHELISSQLDMDRLDYLCRDSFYTGVREGNIGAQRLIQMLEVRDDKLLINEKGIYTVENYLMARRVMYWQVYLHKTTVAAEEVLRCALKRAKSLARDGHQLPCSPALHFFLYNEISPERFANDPECLNQYSMLDDSDILTALKMWSKSEDKVLAILSNDFINRTLFKAIVSDTPLSEETIEEKCKLMQKELGISYSESKYFVRYRKLQNEMYSTVADGIDLIDMNGNIHDLSSVSHIVRNETSNLKDSKYYLLYQRL